MHHHIQVPDVRTLGQRLARGDGDDARHAVCPGHDAPIGIDCEHIDFEHHFLRESQQARIIGERREQGSDALLHIAVGEVDGSILLDFLSNDHLFYLNWKVNDGGEEVGVHLAGIAV